MADESYPEDLKYHPEHDWAQIEGDNATFGITWFAQDQLGEVVFFDPPEVGSDDHGERDATPRSSRSRPSPTSIAPLSGEVTEVNEALGDTPEPINDDPYGQGWLVQGQAERPAEVESLLDVDAYTSEAD